MNQMAGLRSGEAAVTLRFALVGVVATLCYLIASLLLLRLGWWPQIVNVISFAISLLVSYAGHYFFTYTSSESHQRAGSRFGLVTVLSLLLCSGVQQLALWCGYSAQIAAVLIAIIYPPLSLIGNHFWTFARNWNTKQGDV